MTQPDWLNTLNDSSTEPDVARERVVLRRLRELCDWRALEEVEIDRQYDEARSSLGARLESNLATISQKYDSDREALESEYRESIDAIEIKFDTLITSCQRESDEQRAEINRTADLEEQRAKKAWSHEVWLIESDFEANEPLPRREFEKTRRDLDERASEIARLKEHARLLVEQFKQSSILSRDEVAAGDEHGNESSRPAVLPDSDASSEVDSPSAPRASADGQHERPPSIPIDSINEAREALDRQIDESRRLLNQLSRLRIARLFRGPQMGFLGLLIVAGAIALTSWREEWRLTQSVGITAGLSLVFVAAGYIFLYRLARRRVEMVYRPFVSVSREACQLCDQLFDLSQRKRVRDENDIARKRGHELAQARSKYVPMVARAREERRRASKEHNEIYPRRLAELRREHEEKRSEAESRYQEGMADVERWRDQAEEDAGDEHRRETARLNADRQQRWEQLFSGWRNGLSWVFETVDELNAQDHRMFPEWSDASWRTWSPPERFVPVIRFGSITIDRHHVKGGIPADQRLLTEHPARFRLPGWMAFPEPCSLLIETDGDGRGAAARALQNLMLRLLVSLPPGKVRFTIFDPVALGQNFAAFMHLADHTETLVSEKIWTEPRHIDQKLLDLTEHMESVIQKYLRNEYETIAEYNERAGEIAEPYRFLVMADCPVNLTDNAARRLTSIVNTGIRCGVYTLIMFDRRHKIPPALHMDDLRERCVHLSCADDGFRWNDPDFGPYPLTVDAPPGDEQMTDILNRVGDAARDASRVRVPFDVICPTPAAIWSRSSAESLQVELGRAGATKLQSLRLGEGTAQHVLIAGKTGSGKSTLLHVLVTNLSLWYGPNEVEIYLVDFKKGVEFKTYATHQIPHVRAIAIESEREFGVSVLHRVDSEMKRRGDLFRSVGAQDVASFRRLAPKEPLPRTLLIIDEFQEFFTEDDKLAQEAALLLDRLVRQGRAFGIHVILGSQTLGGAYGLARSTIGQMAVRIALQCSEADSFLIMDEDNAAARLLSRPGEAIYNDSSGVVGANSPFQIAWLSEDAREESLRYVRDYARDSNQLADEPPIVFEGSVPAAIQNNRKLRRILHDGARSVNPVAPVAWFGEPIAIKDATNVEFRRQHGANVLIVGQNDESALALAGITLVGLAAQHQARPAGQGGAAYRVLDGTPPDAPNNSFLRDVAKALPHDVEVGGWNEAETTLQQIYEELESRRDSNRTDGPRIFFWVHGLQRFRMLKNNEDDFGFSLSADDEDKPPSVGKMFQSILRDGPVYGIHSLVWCDSNGTLERMLDRHALRDFENRILFQMGSTDSSNLIDSTLASQLGLKRALLFCEELGQLEKFRPYALPDSQWVRDLADAFHHSDS